MSDDEGEPSLPAERTEEDLEARHETEKQEMKKKKQAHIEAVTASAGKGKKAKEKIEVATREAEDWEYKLHVRQQAELDLLQEHLGGGDASGSKAPAADVKETSAAAESKPAEEDEAERAQRKKEKALLKKQGKANKQAEKEAEKEREKLEAGPSQRLLENLALARQLTALSPPMRVQEVAADGHCLYRSIGEQLDFVWPGSQKWKREPEHRHEEVRALCAKALRRNADDYAPFAELKDEEDFEGYCSRVEHSGDWGGHLELRAIADALRVRILVHRAEESEPLVMGDAPGAPLQVAYHQHYYDLGEHYNSILPMTT